MSLPETTPQPCNDCPWRRVAKRGWLGPWTAAQWLAIVHGDSPIACHQTITETDESGSGDWEHPAMRQCRGAAIFREHVCKSPRNPEIETGPEDRDNVFANNYEFYRHHTGDDEITDSEIVRRIVEAPLAR